MKTAIWKFPLSLETKQVLLMPKGAEILSVQTQNDIICIWAEVEPLAKKEERTFEIFGTGFSLPELNLEEDRRHLGTCQTGQLVFHVYEYFDQIQF